MDTGDALLPGTTYGKWQFTHLYRVPSRRPTSDAGAPHSGHSVIVRSSVEWVFCSVLSPTRLKQKSWHILNAASPSASDSATFPFATSFKYFSARKSPAFANPTSAHANIAWL